MNRPGRLLLLIQVLRRHRRPVTAAMLAAELGVSLRTVYRDIATLAEGGAPIEGEAGVGYVLRPGFFLPPLMFTPDELDAVILGLRLAGRRGDDSLERSAADALAKIAAILPPEQESVPATSGLLAGPGNPVPYLPAIRRAMGREEKLRLRYADKKGETTERVVWPVAVGFFAATEVLAAWCETRRDFRHFRLDRIQSAEPLGQRYPQRRRILLADWRSTQNLEP